MYKSGCMVCGEIILIDDEIHPEEGVCNLCTKRNDGY